MRPFGDISTFTSELRTRKEQTIHWRTAGLIERAHLPQRYFYLSALIEAPHALDLVYRAHGVQEFRMLQKEPICWLMVAPPPATFFLLGFGWLVGWLGGWLAGWLAAYLVDWLLGILNEETHEGT